MRVGGGPYLLDLLQSVPVAANAGFYAEIVREKAVLRRLVDASIRIGQMSYAAEGDVTDIVDRAQAEVYGVTDRRASRGLQVAVGADAADAGRDGGHRVPRRRPVGRADRLRRSGRADQRPASRADDHCGRETRRAVSRTLALDLARSASIKNDLGSVIFSLEMSQIEITMRLLSAEAGIPLSHIRGGRMNEQDWSRVSTKMGQVSEAPMFIDDSPNLTMMEIRAKARRLKQRHDLKLVIIDYIQLMTSGKKVESRQLEVSEFSRQLKLLAKELDLPVVALSQLNRGPETRNDKRPMLSDLRESGSLEQDADMVILLSRPDLYDRESERAGEADFDVAKHRNGPTKTITVAFQGHYSRFTDMQR